MRRHTLNTQPPLVLHRILSHLPLREKYSFGMVAKKYHRLFDLKMKMLIAENRFKQHFPKLYATIFLPLKEQIPLDWPREFIKASDSCYAGFTKEERDFFTDLKDGELSKAKTMLKKQEVTVEIFNKKPVMPHENYSLYYWILHCERQDIRDFYYHYLRKNPDSLSLFADACALHQPISEIERLKTCTTYLAGQIPFTTLKHWRVGYTPSDLAIYFGNLPLLKWLYNQGALTSAEYYQMPRWFTAVALAAACGRLEMLKWLVLEAHCSLPTSSGFWDFFTSPLYQAVSEDHFEVVTWLVEQGMNVNARIQYREPLLECALNHSRDLRLINYLTAQSDHPEITLQKFCPYFIAGHSGRVGVAKWLIERQPASLQNVRQKNRCWFEAIFAAVYRGYLRSVKNMLEHGLSPDIAQPNLTGNALSIAIKQEDIFMVSLLLNHGATMDFELQAPPTTPFQMAEAKKEKCPEIFRLFSERRARAAAIAPPIAGLR